MTSTLVILARHGETASNISRTISTQAPGTDLTDNGRQQAIQLGLNLKTYRPSYLYSSNLRRAVQTASIVACLNGLTLKTPLEDLREIDASVLDGRSDDDAYAQLDSALDAWRRGDLHTTIGTATEDGYCLIRRVKSVLVDWAGRHSGATVVGITHGGLIQIAVPHLVANGATLDVHSGHLANCATVELLITATGTITCTAWAGTAVRNQDLSTTDHYNSGGKHTYARTTDWFDGLWQR